MMSWEQQVKSLGEALRDSHLLVCSVRMQYAIGHESRFEVQPERRSGDSGVCSDIPKMS